MEPTATSLLAPWGNFYVILGSAAAALTGLQFIAIAIAAEARVGTEDTQRAFATPTIVHFGSVVLFSAVMSAPWPGLSGLSTVVGVFAFAGVAYVLTVVGHTRRQKDYEPVLEDWVWHAVFPVTGYGALVAGAVSLRIAPSSSLFALGGATILLLFVGIHNSWDAVTYLALRGRR
jgi:hypothetical protein